MDELSEAKALFSAGLAFQERGEWARAEHCYRRALELAPNRPSVMINLAAVLIQDGKCQEAKTIVEKVLKVDPRNPAALLNLGHCQLIVESAEAALTSIEAAVRIKPDYVEALVSRATVLNELDQPGQALESCDKALAMKPDCVDALVGKGIIMRSLRRDESALTFFERALDCQPNCLGALIGRSNVLLDLNRVAEALAGLEKASQIHPGDAVVLSNLALILLRLGEKADALDKVEAALAARPDLAPAHFNHGNILADLGRHDDAASSYERALALKPNLDYARGALVHSRMHCCDWRSFGENAAGLLNDVRQGKRVMDPFSCLGIFDGAKDQLLCSQVQVNDRFPMPPVPIWRGERYGHDRIRVAYLSSDLGNHAVALLMAGVFDLHDRTRFEITAMSFGRHDEGEMRTRLKAAFDRFIDVNHQSDREVACRLRDLEIDIAVDLNGYTKNARPNIFALRAAPIQVNYLGYPGPLGAEWYDYILADRFVIPDQQIGFYSEKVVRLPDCFQANDFRRTAAQRAPRRSEMRLPEQGFIFCCANNAYKITPKMFDVWMKILRDVPDSILWLLGVQPCAISRLQHAAGARGIAPERLFFAGRAPYGEYLARYRVADLFLDTLPFNGGTTASDALWAGLPVLTCPGETFAGRMAGSLLHTLALGELIADSLETYTALAVRLARAPEELTALKRRLFSAREASALFDTHRFRHNLESAYSRMWRRYQDGAPAASFDV